MTTPSSRDMLRALIANDGNTLAQELRNKLENDLGEKPSARQLLEFVLSRANEESAAAGRSE